MDDYRVIFEEAAKSVGISLDRSYRPKRLTDFFALAADKSVQRDGLVLLKDWVAELINLEVVDTKYPSVDSLQPKVRRAIGERRDLGVKVITVKDALGRVYGGYGDFEVDVTKVNEARDGRPKDLVMSTSNIMYKDEAKLEERIRAISEPKVLCRVVFTSDF